MDFKALHKALVEASQMVNEPDWKYCTGEERAKLGQLLYQFALELENQACGALEKEAKGE